MLFKKSYDELVGESLDSLQIYTDVTNVSIGGVARSLLEVINKQLSTYYNVLEVNQVMGFVSRAEGYFLDRIGDLFNLQRELPQGATVTAEDEVQKFYVTIGFLADKIPSLFIPEGTTVSTSDGEINYSVVKDTVFSIGATEVYVPITSTGTGSSINVGKNALISSGYNDDQVYTTNEKPIITGSDTESDENLRYRITNATLSFERANETSIRLAALSVAGVADVILRPYSLGIGSYEVLVIPSEGLAADSLIESVQDAIDEVQAYGIRGIAKSPTVVPIDISVKVMYLDGVTEVEKEDITDDVKTSIERYIVNIPVGGTFILNELRQQIMDVSYKIKDHVITCYYFKEQPHILGNVVIYGDEMFYPNPDSAEAITCIGV